MAASERRWPKWASGSWPASSSKTRIWPGSIRRKLDPSARVARVWICPAISTPVGPAPTIATVSHPARCFGSSLSSAISSACSRRAAQAKRIVEGLHPGRVLGQFVVPEVRLPGSGGHDQAVVGYFARRPVRALDVNQPALQVEPGDGSQHHLGVPLEAQHMPQRRGDLPFGQDARGHLVEQRLEQVMGLAIDECDVDGRPGERARREQATKTSAHDDDAMLAILHAKTMADNRRAAINGPGDKGIAHSRIAPFSSNRPWLPFSAGAAASEEKAMGNVYDVIIIGTGAGGGTLALDLAPLGQEHPPAGTRRVAAAREGELER